MGEDVGSVPLEFVGEVARPGAMGEPGNVKRSSAATRHCRCVDVVLGRWWKVLCEEQGAVVEV
jgi:hypothetical protein